MATVKDYATLSNLVYEAGGGAPDPNSGWVVYATPESLGMTTQTGYYGVAYLNTTTKEIVVAHRGTQLLTDTGDLKSNWQNIAGQVPDQFPDARTFYNLVQQRVASDLTLSNINITYSHTGHSLGGAIARQLSVEQSQVGVTFNALGDNGQLPAGADTSKLLAINAKYDKVSEFGTQVGTVIEKYVSYISGIPDSWEPLLALLTFKIPALGLLVNSHYYYDQHSMDSLLAVVAADPSLARLDPAAGPLDVTADGDIVGSGLNEWADLEAALQADPSLWSGGLLPEDTLTLAQISAEQNVDPATPIVYDHTGPATWIVGENGADILSGDAGNDLIFGLAGNDTLTGGKGNDYLEGGPGTDTYLYTSGDGLDTILDTDGLGKITFDGVDLRGGDKLFGETYKSTDGNYLYTLLQKADGQDLLVSAMGGQIIVKDFQSGELGIAPMHVQKIHRNLNSIRLAV